MPIHILILVCALQTQPSACTPETAIDVTQGPRVANELMCGKMGQAADEYDYERAAMYRDQIKAVERVMERQQMATTKPEDMDLFTITDDPNQVLEIVSAATHRHARRPRE